MKKSIFTIALLLCCFHVFLIGQFPSTFETEERICDYNLDSSEKITQLKDFNIFQTQNGEIDSPIDSSQCLLIEKDGWQKYITLDQIDISKPIFMKLRLQDSLQYPMPSNSLYHINANMSFENLNLVDGNDCAADECTMVSIHLKYPNDDEGNESGKVSEYTFPGIKGLESCFVSQNLEDQYLEDVLIRIVIDDEPENQSRFYVPNFWINIDYLGWVTEIDKIIVPESYRIDDTSYSANFYNLFQSDIVILKHDNGAYPSSNNIDYVEVELEEKQDEQQTIDLYSTNVINVFLQDYVEIRGELVEGSDSLRHKVNLIFDDNAVCVQIVDFVSGNNVDLYFRNDSQMEMKSKASCVRIEKGSAINIQQEKFELGRNSIGMLALYDNATINISENASFTIGGRFTLNQRESKGQPRCNVQANGKLEFGKGARISSYVEGLQLHVYLYDNAEIDMSNLSINDQAKIKVIRRSSEFSVEDLKVYPNPTSSLLNIPIDFDGDLAVSIYNSVGEKVFAKNLTAIEGEEYFQLDTQSFSEGIYLLTLRVKNKRYATKFLKN